jgi:hypothetical protein
MTAHVRFTPSITDLLEHHANAWAAFDTIWPAPDHVVERLCHVHQSLFEAKPVSMKEWFEKWRVIAKFESELGDESDVAQIVTTMLNELAALNGRWT